MPEEPISQETPEESGSPQETPAETSTETQHDYESRYKDLQAEYTRSKQEMAQQRELIQALQSDDEEDRRYALERLGYELPDEEEDYEEPDQSEFDRYLDERLQARLDERLTPLEQQILQREEIESRQQEVEADFEDFTEQLENLQDKEGREFTAEELELLHDYSMVRRNSDGRRDVEGAYKALLGYAEGASQRILESKKAAQAKAGMPALEEIDLSDDKARQKAILARMEQQGS